MRLSSPQILPLIFLLLILESYLGIFNIHLVSGISDVADDFKFATNITDPNLKAESVVKGLEYPTSIAFLGPDDLLVTENKGGKVQRVVNGSIMPQPLLDVNVANYSERCMCGIAVSKNVTDLGQPYVFLYFTQAATKADEDLGQDTKPIGNRLFRYELNENGTSLINPKLLLDLPSIPGAWHNGGAIMIGPDNYIYIPIGDVNASYGVGPETMAQNHKNGTKPDGRAGILRISQAGEVIKPIIGDEYPLSLYYAYGIRNSFGIDFDPITGKLWDTENGPICGDEINLIEPGFNSGWDRVQGMLNSTNDFHCVDFGENTLVDFGGVGKYSDPEFVWNITVGPTSLKFLASDKLGIDYENDLFVADIRLGNIYHFDLNENRSGFLLNGSLVDKIADSNEQLGDILFAENRAGITDLEVGPDGYLYAALYDKAGEILRIASASEKYELPTGIEGRYVRITVNGNSENDWASASEIAVTGSSLPHGSCSDVNPRFVGAIGNDGNIASNVNDGDKYTRWSNYGIGSWIQLDLGANYRICSLDISWFRGEFRQINFTVSLSNDGINFDKVFTGISKGPTN
jgi:glucose/arabinose dehydrogenase